MMWDEQFVVFICSWSTGKTICMREKARIRATDNPSENLYFCVVVNNGTKNTTLLEMELKHYFQEHNLQNITVIGLPSDAVNTMSELHKKMLSMPAGSWMIDELAMPQGTWPQIYTVLNFGMTIFNFHFLLLFLANLTSNWVIFDEKMERQA